MASQRITCPECKTILRPSKPVPDGKKVKCPECGMMFTTPGFVEEEERPRKKAPAKPKAKAAVKKPSSPPPPPPKPATDDDEGGIYSYISEDAKAEEDKPEIEYAPDLSIKDLRGPAQAAVVTPSNYIMLIGGISCLLDLFIICVCFWPMVFSESPIDWETFLEKHYKGNKQALNRISGYKEYKDIQDEDIDIVRAAERESRFQRFLGMGGFILMFIYNGITIVGAVKMQNLESRGWGIASSIMTILPFGSLGIITVVIALVMMLFLVMLEDGGLATLYGCGGGLLMWFAAIYVGVKSLRVLMSEEVIAGFEYVAD